jgi:hypothetical protein
MVYPVKSGFNFLHLFSSVVLCVLYIRWSAFYLSSALYYHIQEKGDICSSSWSIMLWVVCFLLFSKWHRDLWYDSSGSVNLSLAVLQSLQVWRKPDHHNNGNNDLLRHCKMLYMVWGVIIFLFSDTFRVEALNLKCER